LLWIRLMTDCKVEMINNGMQEFFLQFHKPKHSKFLTSFSGISLNMIYTTFSLCQLKCSSFNTTDCICFNLWSTDTDTDTSTLLIIWENHIIQCNYMFRCRTWQVSDIGTSLIWEVSVLHRFQFNVRYYLFRSAVNSCYWPMDYVL